MDRVQKNPSTRDQLQLKQNYAETLRVLGLEAAKFSPQLLEIKCVGNQFHIHGTTTLRPEQAAPGMRKQPLGKIRVSRGSKTGDRPKTPGAVQTFDLVFTSEELTKLNRKLSYNREWREERKPGGKAADIYLLSELLRTIGIDLDAQENRLLKLTKNVHSISVLLQDRKGVTITRDYSAFSLHKKQQEVLPERSKPVADPWKDVK